MHFPMGSQVCLAFGTTRNDLVECGSIPVSDAACVFHSWKPPALLIQLSRGCRIRSCAISQKQTKTASTPFVGNSALRDFSWRLQLDETKLLCNVCASSRTKGLQPE